jgi:hypothetical protein
MFGTRDEYSGTYAVYAECISGFRNYGTVVSHITSLYYHNVLFYVSNSLFQMWRPQLQRGITRLLTRENSVCSETIARMATAAVVQGGSIAPVANISIHPDIPAVDMDSEDFKKFNEHDYPSATMKVFRTGMLTIVSSIVLDF